MSSQDEFKKRGVSQSFPHGHFLKGDLSAADEILLPDFIWRNPSIPPNLQHGPEK